MTSYVVCGHLLDLLSAWDHSDTLLKPEQAHFGRLYGIMFFWKDSPQTEGRRDAHHLIKTWPGISRPFIWPWRAAQLFITFSSLEIRAAEMR